jgi:cell division protein ZapB
MDTVSDQTDLHHAELQALAAKLAQLVDVARKLDAENRSLKSTHAELLAERTLLASKNDQARARIEAMISRLKAMEQNV